MWEVEGNSEYSAVAEANGGIFQKGEKNQQQVKHQRI